MNDQVKIVKNFIGIAKDAFPPSSIVDFILMILGEKRCLRTLVLADEYLNAIETFCSKYNFKMRVDRESYLFIATDDEHLNLVFVLDNEKNPHEFELGRAFGYPECCCKKIAEVGEENIDNYEQNINLSSFPKGFELINTSGYVAGSAFISHVPCKTTCKPSLQQAQKFENFILKNREMRFFQHWVQKRKILQE